MKRRPSGSGPRYNPNPVSKIPNTTPVEFAIREYFRLRPGQIIPAVRVRAEVSFPRNAVLKALLALRDRGVLQCIKAKGQGSTWQLVPQDDTGPQVDPLEKQLEGHPLAEANEKSWDQIPAAKDASGPEEYCKECDNTGRGIGGGPCECGRPPVDLSPRVEPDDLLRNASEKIVEAANALGLCGTLPLPELYAKEVVICRTTANRVVQLIAAVRAGLRS